MNAQLAIRPAREAFRLWSAAVCGALACMVAAGCSSSEESDPPPSPPQTQEITRVERPRVAMLNADTAAITYVQSVTSNPVVELVTSRHSLSTGASTLLARADFDSSDPYALTAGGNGLAISLSGNRETTGCVISMVDTVSCTVLDPNRSSVVAAAPGAPGELVVLYGANDALQQRTYDQAGWAPTRTVPALGPNKSVDTFRSLVRRGDGLMFLAAKRVGEAVAARANFPGIWQTFDNLGSPVAGNYDPQIALHPDAPGAFPIVVWESVAGIVFSIGQDTGGWSSAAIIPGGERGNAPSVAMWANGETLAIWRNVNGTVIAARLINGVWEPAVAVDEAPTVSNRRVAVGLDRHGNAVAVWRADMPDQPPSLKSASYLAGVGWQPAATVGTLTTSSIEGQFDVAMEPEGRALAVWVRPAPGNLPGSRLGIAEVGPFALSSTVQRYAFGGEAVAVTVHLGRAPAQATTLAVSTTLPATSVTLPASVPVPANQQVVTFNVPSNAVSDFVDGRLEVTYENVTSSQPVTLMPEPTAVALSVTPATVLGGEAAIISLQVTPIYPVALTLQLESNNAVAPVPAQVTTSMTSSAAAVPVTTMTTTTAQTAIFTARFRNRSGTGSLLVNPTSLGQSVLTVSVFSPGTGTVTSTPAGITNCSQTCTASYPIGTPVTLTPTPTLGHRFFAWEGDPDCSEGKLTMLTARTCRAIFLVGDQPYPDGTGWTQIARLLPDLNYVNPSPALALEGVIPIVAHLSKVTPTAVPQIYVQRLQGANSTYLQMGSDSLNIDKLKAASEPAIATTNNGLPYVAWIEGSGAQQNLYVSRIIYGNRLEEWVSVGPLNTPLNYVAGSRASSPSIALDAEFNPMVAWIEDGAVRFKRFNGTAWVQVQGGEGPASAGADRVRLSSHSTAPGVADPVIAWTQGSGMSRALKVVRDFAFTPLGTQVNPASPKPLIEFAVLAESNGGIVTWGDGGDAVLPFTIRSQRWDGTTWVNVGGQVVNNNPHRLVSLAMAWNGLGVVWNYRFVPNDTSHLGVSTFRNGFWSLITTELVVPGDANVGPTPVEFANLDSPIVVRVERNALSEYIWWTLRYYRP